MHVFLEYYCWVGWQSFFSFYFFFLLARSLLCAYCSCVCLAGRAHNICAVWLCEHLEMHARNRKHKIPTYATKGANMYSYICSFDWTLRMILLLLLPQPLYSTKKCMCSFCVFCLLRFFGTKHLIREIRRCNNNKIAIWKWINMNSTEKKYIFFFSVRCVVLFRFFFLHVDGLYVIRVFCCVRTTAKNCFQTVVIAGLYSLDLNLNWEIFFLSAD